MAEDTMKGREPGEPGSTIGQINTPMCSTNVGDEGGGKTHSYKDITKGATGEGGAGIAGPGVNSTWKDISGTNKPGKY